MAAKKLDQKLLDILLRYGEKPETALWDCHGTWVAYHKALERIAAKAKIVFDVPEIIVADANSKIAVIYVTGKMGDRSEWSFGEAAPYNNKNGYPFAMAEKRAKDRVTLKLIGLHGEVYSEEESDDFKPGAGPPPKSSMSLKRADDNGKDAWDRLITDLRADLVDCRSLAGLEQIKAIYRERAKQERWPKAWKDALADEFEGAEKEITDNTFPGDLPDGKNLLAAG